MKIDYEKAKNVPNLDTVYLRGNSEQTWRAFKGLGKDGLLTINTKTYLDEPLRSNDGSMGNINDSKTFIVPQVELNFKYLNLEDYTDFCDILEQYNEFEAKYFDVRYKQWVTHKMYCKPQEMTRIYNIRTSVIGVFDYKVQLVGTLNNIPKTCKIYYVKNIASGDSTHEYTVTYKSPYYILNASDSDYVFTGWNTSADGTGTNYLAREKIIVVSDIRLFGQWVKKE